MKDKRNSRFVPSLARNIITILHKRCLSVITKERNSWRNPRSDEDRNRETDEGQTGLQELNTGENNGRGTIRCQ